MGSYFKFTKRQWINFILGALIFVGVVLLIALGIGIVHPYHNTVVYEEAQCSAVNVTSYGHRTCSCGVGGKNEKDCTSEYPCVRITVNIHPPANSVIRGSSLFNSYSAGSENELCTFRPCDKSPEANDREVAGLVQTYGNTNTTARYTCLFNPINPTEVILERPTALAAAMAMLWPSLLIAVCAPILVIRCLRQRSQ